MRYPLWAFLAVFVVPPFTAHALLTDAARFEASGLMAAAPVTRPLDSSRPGTVAITVRPVVAAHWL